MKKYNNIFSSIIVFTMLCSGNVCAMKKMKDNVTLQVIEKFSPVLILSYKDDTVQTKKVLKIRYLNTIRSHLGKKIAFEYDSENLTNLKNQKDEGSVEQLVHDIIRIGYNKCSEIKQNVSFFNWIMSAACPKHADLVDMYDYHAKEKKRIPQTMKDKFVELILKYSN